VLDRLVQHYRRAPPAGVLEALFPKGRLELRQRFLARAQFEGRPCNANLPLIASTAPRSGGRRAGRAYGLGPVAEPMHAESPQLVFMNTAVEKHSGALGEHDLPTVRGAGAAGPNLDVHEGFRCC
jgi:hypothetical protein